VMVGAPSLSVTRLEAGFVGPVGLMPPPVCGEEPPLRLLHPPAARAPARTAVSTILFSLNVMVFDPSVNPRPAVKPRDAGLLIHLRQLVQQVEAVPVPRV